MLATWYHIGVGGLALYDNECIRLALSRLSKGAGRDFFPPLLLLTLLCVVDFFEGVDSPSFGIVQYAGGAPGWCKYLE